MKISNTKNAAAIGKAKKSGKSNKTSGVSFDSLVEKAGAVDKTQATAGVDAVDGVSSGASGAGRYIPQDAEGRGEYMLTQLEELERDILNGKHSGAVHRLKEALQTQAVNREDMSDELLAILDEIEMRASVEVAKMEASKDEDF